MIAAAPPPTAPREVGNFDTEPLSFLMQARNVVGPICTVQEGGPIFSRDPGCALVIAASGADAVRDVLSDAEAFGMPLSASPLLYLPPNLARLTRSLHTMVAPAHGQHKRALTRIINRLNTEPAHIDSILDACISKWPVGESQPLFARMRELSLRLATEVLLGPDVDGALPSLLLRYFNLRRAAASRTSAYSESGLRRELQSSGVSLDRALRAHFNRRTNVGLFRHLLDPLLTAGTSMTEDDAVGHANILFVSATEPVAVALTWTLLILSQRPELQKRVREDDTTLNETLLESLRLLPPNGFMVRLTTRAVRLGRFELPPRCEVMLCTLILHRDPAIFDRPDSFDPQRWRRIRPSPFEYLPFGAGVHACAGRRLGMALMRAGLRAVLRRGNVVLDADQEVDWRLNVQFMPREEITVRFVAPDQQQVKGRWLGAFAAWGGRH